MRKTCPFYSDYFGCETCPQRETCAVPVVPVAKEGEKRRNPIPDPFIEDFFPFLKKKGKETF